MTLLNKENSEKGLISENKKQEELNEPSSEETSSVESQFNRMMEQFRASNGFSINTGEPAVDTMIEVLSSKGVMISLTILLSYIRYCINNGVKKDITVKIGYNKPTTVPMNFAINEEMLEDIYPGDTIEIN